MSKTNWEVEVNGIKHTIKYKKGIRPKIIVDGEKFKVKSSNSFINVIDYKICFEDTECHLVALGNKIDLSVNGTYLGSKEEYKPIDNVPGWVYVLVGLSCLGGMLIGGITCLCLGAIMSIIYIQASLNKKTKTIIASFAACTLLQIIMVVIIRSLLHV